MEKAFGFPDFLVAVFKREEVRSLEHLTHIEFPAVAMTTQHSLSSPTRSRASIAPPFKGTVDVFACHSNEIDTTKLRRRRALPSNKLQVDELLRIYDFGSRVRVGGVLDP